MIHRALIILSLMGTGCASTHTQGRSPESIVESASSPPSILEDLRHIYAQRGMEAATRFYLDAQNEDPMGYTIEERDLNTLGYEAMGAGKFQEAIQFFAVNREYFPTSTAYLAQGYGEMALGDLGAALHTFEHVLELDPTNQTAAAMVEALSIVDECEQCQEKLADYEREAWEE